MKKDINLQNSSKSYIARLQKLLSEIELEKLEQAAKLLTQAYEKNKKVLIIGNGGSAATASHMATDLSKTVRGHKLSDKIKGFRAISLTDSSANITALSNDTGYENVYSEQIKTQGEKEDILIAISSSGNSPNIIKATALAQKMGLKVITITGFGGGKLGKMGDTNIITHHNEYGPVEDIQLIINHILTSYFAEKLS